MRTILATAVVAAFSISMIPATADAAAGPAKTKMGCIIGKEKWNAVDGKCVAAKPVAKAAVKKA